LHSSISSMIKGYVVSEATINSQVCEVNHW
jgi:hypothetical protein